MKSDFEAKHIKKAAKALDKHIRTIQSYSNINQQYKKEIFKKSFTWKKILDFFKF